MTTRYDIQGLRGIAVVFIVLFHFFPRNFPNSYIGVDIIFVITGYFTSVHFREETKITIQNIGLFYFKKIKRIFPLYYLILPSTILAVQFIVSEQLLEAINDLALFALALLKNLQAIHDGEDYFKEVNSTKTSKDPFLHLWLIAVEMQFYLIAPILFLILEKIPKITYQLLFVSGAAKTSFIYHTSISEIAAFNCLLSRFWEFCIGIMANNLQQDVIRPMWTGNEQLSRVKEALGYVFQIYILVALVPVKLNRMLLQLVLSSASAAVLYIGGHFDQNRLLTAKVLVYVGDISYVLYLVHWPIIVFIGIKSVQRVQAVIILLILLSVLLHHCYEKIYRGFTPKWTGFLLVFLLLFNVNIILVVRSCPQFRAWINDWHSHRNQYRVKHVIEENTKYVSREILPNCKYVNLREFTKPWGLCKYPKGNGTRSVLVVGNDFALNQANLIHEEFHGNYSSFHLLTNKSYQVIFDEFVVSNGSSFRNQWRREMELIEQLKPKIIYAVTRFSDSQKRPILGNIEEDRLLKEYNAEISKLEAVSERILIHNVYPLYRENHLNNYITALQNDIDLSSFHLNKEIADAEMYWARRRILNIRCKKCVIYDTSIAFQSDGVYLTYDDNTLLSFIDNDNYFTPAGIDKLRPLYKQLAQQ